MRVDAATAGRTGEQGADRTGEQGGERHRRSTVELRARLLAAAGVEFSAHGYANTTNRDVAKRAGVALSVLYRHFETKADLFSEAVLDPFVRGFEQLATDWMHQRDDPLPDDELMAVFLRDIYGSLVANQHAMDQMLFGRSELPDKMVDRIQDAFDTLINQVTLMTELEAHRRGWMSTQGINMAVRVLLGMAIGMASYSRVLLPPGAASDSPEVLDGMIKLGLRGMTKQRDVLDGHTAKGAPNG